MSAAEFILWAREFVGEVRDTNGTLMTDELWEQLDSLEKEVAPINYVRSKGHRGISPCEQNGKICRYPLSDGPREYTSRFRDQCSVCSWIK